MPTYQRPPDDGHGKPITTWPGDKPITVCYRSDRVGGEVVLSEDWRVNLDDALIDRIKTHIRANTTQRHVPAKVLQVTDIPRTKSNKIVELAVRNVVHGRDVKNIEALANPDALEQYRDREELRS